MGTQPHQGSSDVSPIIEGLRRQLEADRQRLAMPEEAAEIESAHEDWASEMERLDTAYEAMLEANPALRQRLADKDAVLAALLNAVSDDRDDR